MTNPSPAPPGGRRPVHLLTSPLPSPLKEMSPSPNFILFFCLIGWLLIMEHDRDRDRKGNVWCVLLGLRYPSGFCKSYVALLYELKSQKPSIWINEDMQGDYSLDYLFSLRKHRYESTLLYKTESIYLYLSCSFAKVMHWHVHTHIEC